MRNESRAPRARHLIRRLTRSGLIPLLALLPGACVTAPSAPSPATPKVPARLDAPAANAEAGAGVDRWWTAWGDASLDALVARALAANTDIRVARAHVAAARAVASVAESALYPTIAANGAVWGSESDTGFDGPYDTLLPSGSGGDGHLVGLGARWEPDLFGGRHADAAAARALAESAERAADAVRLVVAGDVVENYLELDGMRRRLAILDRSIATASRLADYADARMRTGAATVADVTRARDAAAALRAQRPALTALIDARRRRLAVLAGAVPEQPPLAQAGPGFAAPPAPGGQLPSAVLERRPDVLARAAAVRARAARLKSLRTDLLPRFAITFLGQDGRIAISGLPGFGGTGGVLGLSASMPIFNAGRLRARVAEGDAELEAAAAAYDKAVLTALEEVESAYGFRAGLDGRLRGLQQALDLASLRAEQMQALYEAGRVQFGDLLQARLDVLSDTDRLEQARIARGSATVQLYRALGGGWTPPAPGPAGSTRSATAAQ